MSDSPKTLKSPLAVRTICVCVWVSLGFRLTWRLLSVFTVHAQACVFWGSFRLCGGQTATDEKPGSPPPGQSVAQRGVRPGSPTRQAGLYGPKVSHL